MSEVAPELATSSQSEEPAPLPTKFTQTTAGQFLIACLIIGVIGAVVAVSVVVGGSRSPATVQQANQSALQVPPDDSAEVPIQEDPIEQARVVLGGAYSYELVQAATDAALVSTATPVTTDNYSRAWSSVLAVTANLDVEPMDVMLCVPQYANSDAGLTFPQVVALCATDLHLSIG